MAGDGGNEKHDLNPPPPAPGASPPPPRPVSSIGFGGYVGPMNPTTQPAPARPSAAPAQQQPTRSAPASPGSARPGFAPAPPTPPAKPAGPNGAGATARAEQARTGRIPGADGQATIESPVESVEPAATTAAAPQEPEHLAGVSDRMQAAPWEFSFFSAVRLLECLRPDLPRMGYSVRPEQDPVRFGQEPLMYFPPCSVHSFRPAPARKADDTRPAPPPRMAVTFMGLLGPNGPMPTVFADYVRGRRAKGDRSLPRFLDVFNHRMVSLFYRTWAQHQRTVGFDRPEDDRWAVYIGSLFGIGTDAVRHRDSVSDVAKLHFAGRLVNQTRHAEGLAAICESYFGAPARVEQFVGQFIEIPPANRSALGGSPETGIMGQNILMGSRVWDVQQKFRVVMGPMDFKSYFRLLPVGSSLDRFVDWVRNYIGYEYDWEVRLVLKADEVPQVKLGSLGHLGWSSWMRSLPEQNERGDLALDSQSADRFKQMNLQRRGAAEAAAEERKKKKAPRAGQTGLATGYVSGLLARERDRGARATGNPATGPNGRG